MTLTVKELSETELEEITLNMTRGTNPKLNIQPAIDIITRGGTALIYGDNAYQAVNGLRQYFGGVNFVQTTLDRSALEKLGMADDTLAFVAKKRRFMD